MTSHPIVVHPDPSAVGEVSGRSVVLAYGSAAAEYEALRKHAIVVDRSHRARLRMTGAKAGEMLTGLVTNDVLALEPGQGLYAAALTPKGKIAADVRIFAEEGGFLVDCPPRAAEPWIAMVSKYVNPRLAPYTVETETLRDVGIFGVGARHVVAEITGASASALGILPMYSHVNMVLDGARVVVARVPDLELEGFELFAPAEAWAALWDRALAARALPAGLEAWEIARVEAGRPEWGIDMDDSTIPQEANLDELHAISYTKGCYVGQETVARVHFRGHVNRHLRGIRTASQEPPPTQALLFDGEGREVGQVRSAVSSPRLGGIAIAMIRREVELGAQLTARWEGGESHVDVSHLPFPL
ncbi:MAG TPA: glycine cleavage T C-terminal barrel domain-containing protein [Gemmatimonadaceae bacterium]|nr:glycine cleavage T C-terminal barrel domain-containing protein [Gemmatimonadaceae bacterium]